jgi:hypothetical protein
VPYVEDVTPGWAKFLEGAGNTAEVGRSLNDKHRAADEMSVAQRQLAVMRGLAIQKGQRELDSADALDQAEGAMAEGTQSSLDKMGAPTTAKVPIVTPFGIPGSVPVTKQNPLQAEVATIKARAATIKDGHARALYLATEQHRLKDDIAGGAVDAALGHAHDSLVKLMQTPMGEAIGPTLEASIAQLEALQGAQGMDPDAKLKVMSQITQDIARAQHGAAVSLRKQDEFESAVATIKGLAAGIPAGNPAAGQLRQIGADVQAGVITPRVGLARASAVNIGQVPIHFKDVDGKVREIYGTPEDALENARKDRDFEELKRFHDMTIAARGAGRAPGANGTSRNGTATGGGAYRITPTDIDKLSSSIYEDSLDNATGEHSKTRAQSRAEAVQQLQLERAQLEGDTGQPRRAGTEGLTTKGPGSTFAPAPAPGATQSPATAAPAQQRTKWRELDADERAGVTQLLAAGKIDEVKQLGIDINALPTSAQDEIRAAINGKQKPSTAKESPQAIKDSNAVFAELNKRLSQPKGSPKSEAKPAPAPQAAPPQQRGPLNNAATPVEFRGPQGTFQKDVARQEAEKKANRKGGTYQGPPKGASKPKDTAGKPLGPGAKPPPAGRPYDSAPRGPKHLADNAAYVKDAVEWASQQIMGGKKEAQREHDAKHGSSMHQDLNLDKPRVEAGMQGKKAAYEKARAMLLAVLEHGPDELTSLRLAKLDELAKTQGVIQ